MDLRDPTADVLAYYGALKASERASESVAPRPSGQSLTTKGRTQSGQTRAMRPFDSLSLATERLTLRPLREDDAEALYTMFSDPQVMRYWSNPPWTTLDQAHAFIASDIEATCSGRYLRLGLERGADQALIGQCTLYDFNKQCRRAEMGYSLTAAAWGQGFMHEALTALVGYAFGELDLNRIEADIDPRNAGSARTLERLGFQREGLMRQRWIVAEEVSDTGFYGLLRSDWESLGHGL